MGPGGRQFESGRPDLTGQIEVRFICPVFILPKIRVERVNKAYCFIDPISSKYESIECHFFGIHRTNDFPLLFAIPVFINEVQLKEVVQTRSLRGSPTARSALRKASPLRTITFLPDLLSPLVDASSSDRKSVV